AGLLPVQAQDPDIDRLIKKLPPPEKLVKPRAKAAIEEQGDRIAKDPLFRDLSRALSAGKAAQALGIIQELEKKFPSNPAPPFLYGAFAWRLERYALAAPAFARAAALAPTFTEAHFGAGFCYMLTGQHKSALPHLREMTRQWPNYSLSWLLLSACTEYTGRMVESADHARRAAQLDPSSPAAWMQMARVERALRRPASAIAALTRAAQLLPNDGTIQSIVGFTYINFNRISDATPHLERAARALPNDYLVRSQLGFCYYAAGRMPQAVTELRKGASLNQQYGPVWLHLGSTYLRMGRYQEAADALEKARRLMPNHPLPRERLKAAQRALARPKNLAGAGSRMQFR
ncbi:MAG TPA: tetratricopeptide repeat protein, partial [Chthoniobacterales bacterium]|nr:tetratricopeptide repeat protein [Chthoniobacterales bacterium]